MKGLVEVILTPVILFVGGMILAAVVLSGCTPSEWATVETVASDAVKIAEVLCLADHAQKARVQPDSMTLTGLCQTVEQLAPYMPMAKHPGMAKFTVDSDAGAP